jgi:hypothetical protein
VEPGSHGGGFFDDEEQPIAAIGQDIGSGAAWAAPRSWRLAGNPRAPAGAGRAELRASLEPILRDMRGSGVIVPHVVEEARADPGPDCASAWIQPRDGAEGG